MEKGAKLSMAHESHNVGLQSAPVILLVQAFRIIVEKEDCSRWIDVSMRLGMAAATFLLQDNLTH